MSGAPPAALWRASEAAAACDGHATAAWSATGVTIDSRTVGGGDLFVALRGPRFDGHDFVGDAFAGGAAAAMVERAPAGLPDRAPLLVVAESQRALEALGKAARARTAAQVIGVTGSVGKTGTKEMLGRALAALGPTHASRLSHNNAIGVPLTLAGIRPADAYAVVEIGMNHAGEIAVLARQVRPHVAVITAVTPAHLGNFADIDAIARAKAEIFQGLEPGGGAVLNRDNPHFPQLRAAARQAGIERIIGFGSAADAEVGLLDYRAAPGRNRVRARVGGETIDYELAIDGRHWATNSLAVLAVVHLLGGDVGRAAGALAGMAVPKGRGARHVIDLGDGALELIDDSYNANPASMRAALETLGADRPKGAGRRIAVLGDMLELGPNEACFHARLAGDVVAANVDLAFTVGSRMRHLHAALPPACRGGHVGDAEQIITMVLFALGRGDVVLVKGSLASGMNRVVEALLAASQAPRRPAANRRC